MEGGWLPGGHSKSLMIGKMIEAVVAPPPVGGGQARNATYAQP
jgi:hypothetical protein